MKYLIFLWFIALASAVILTTPIKAVESYKTYQQMDEFERFVKGDKSQESSWVYVSPVEGVHVKYLDDNTLVLITEGTHQYIDSHIASLVMEVTADPVYKYGDLVGYKLWNFEGDSLFAAAGLKNNDIVISIDQDPLGYPAEAIAKLLSIRGEGSFSIEVIRDGIPKNFHVRII